jgi:hypothetical protein
MIMPLKEILKVFKDYWIKEQMLTRGYLKTNSF